MKTLIILSVFGLVPHDIIAVTHTLRYFYTASSQVPNIPEFVVVGLVNDAQIVYFDSLTRTTEQKQDWMIKTTEADPQYWTQNNWNFMVSLQISEHNMKIAMQRFNQTGGVHIYQLMCGCEWDDETGEANGFYQFGYDGKDFIAFDLKTNTWITPVQQAVITQQKWNNDKALLAFTKNYITRVCPDWLKKYIGYGMRSLMRTDLPSVSLLQKLPSSPVSCHASGFYPKNAVMFWRKDGEKLKEDVEHGEIIPNNDGSFQMSVDLLKLPSEDWGRYECVFQLFRVKEDIIIKLNKDAIKTNYNLPSVSLLQESPSSPVSCHASGFSSNNAVIFWRKDGNELYDDVEHGEIIPNNDGSFQMSVDLLKLPSEDWGRYECVFQLPGVQEDIVTKLNKDAIKTNYTPRFTLFIITAVAFLVLIVCVTVSCSIIKKRKAERLSHAVTYSPMENIQE